ncbi:MAG: hypothetical protein GWO08_00460, partial [Gammaproteobacteria bacterium]|nr:hypothetical protein [Gammaproteobacteria bacterium]NIW44630.1 hypothetical protein [Gammaproteobacteria bacterium]
NHRELQISAGFPGQLVSEFNPTKPGITVRNQLLSAPQQDGGAVDFKDPWFIDYPDPDYGDNLRNRGMDDSGPDALRFWSRTSP